jgi:hypothetical protein
LLKRLKQLMPAEITTLEEMLDRICSSDTDGEEISLGRIVESVGERSFGPMLLTVGIVMLSPISGVPGIPTTMGIAIVIIAGQLIVGREHFWLPRWLLKRSASRGKVYKAVKLMRPLARVVDRLLRPRLHTFIEGVATYAVAFVCIIIAIMMPMMEIVPFSAHAAGIAVTAFGLSMIARDGLVALVAFTTTAVTFGTVVYNVFL